MQDKKQGSYVPNFRMVLWVILFFYLPLAGWVIISAFLEHGWHQPNDTELGLGLICLALVAIERLLAWREKVAARKRRDELIPLVAEEMKKPDGMKQGFYLLESKILGWDRFFKVFVDQRGMHGAYLAAQVYDEMSAGLIIHAAQEAESAAAPLVNSLVAKRYEREAEYESILLGSPEFLAKDKKCFSYSKEEITKITYNPRRSFRTEGVTNQGTLSFYTLSGRRRFIITGAQDVVPILALLERFLTAVEYV